MITILIIVVIAVAIIIYAKRSGKKISIGGKKVIYAPKDRWEFAYGNPNPTLKGTEFEWGTEEPHYLLYGTGPINPTGAMFVKYRIDVLSGDPAFIAQDQPKDATPKAGEIAMIIQRLNDNLSAKGEYEHYRWWAQSRYKLTPGEHYLEYSLVPEDEKWRSVFTKSSKEKKSEYLAALKNAGNIGLTFGGWGAGHGVKVTGGKVKFTILEFGVKQ